MIESGVRRSAEPASGAPREDVFMALLDLRKVSKSFGAIKALTDVDLQIERGRDRRAHGRQRRRQVDAWSRSSPAIFRPPQARSCWTARRCISTSRSRRAAKGIEVVYQDLALCDNLTAAANVFLGREIKKRRGPIKMARSPRHDRAGGRAVRRAEIRDAAARSRAADVGRPAPGRRHRAHPALGSQDRADGRADGGDLACARSPRCSA